jgi:RAD51-like protein 2
MVERVLQIAEACIEDMSEYSHHFHKDNQAFGVKMHPNSILENIFYFRVCSYTEQIALVNYLDKFVTEHKDVSIVFIYSIDISFGNIVKLILHFNLT